MNPARHWLIVSPSPVDNDENEQQSGLIVVTNDMPMHKVFRGVVHSIGAEVAEEIQRGDLAYYVNFVPVRDLHAIHARDLLGWDDA